MRIIPAIDIIEGACVRLTQGDYDTKKVYHKDPLEVAKEFEDAGIKYLHLVDLDGAKSKKIVNHKVLENITNATELIVDFGGGIKSEEDLNIAFNAGAQQVSINTLAVKDPSLLLAWGEKYGKDRFIVGADSLNEKIAFNGWKETSDQSIHDFLTFYSQRGFRYFMCTDISKDGKMEGPAFDLYKTLLDEHAINLIASGGISRMADVRKLGEMGCEAAIIGKAIYEHNILLKELKAYVEK